MGRNSLAYPWQRLRVLLALASGLSIAYAVRAWACDSDDDCKAGRVCRRGSCAGKDSCDDDMDCPGAKVCEQGKCAEPKNNAAEEARPVTPRRSYRDEDVAPTLGQFCCDLAGLRRCIIPPMPIGSGCFCYGQGAGITCG